MRKKLGELNEERFRIRAKVGDFGLRPAYRGPPLETVLLVNVRKVENDAFLTDHLWLTKGVWSYGIQVGDVIEFNARVKPYWKGYYKDEKDYKVANPTGVAIVS
jgi:hypothetical protein